VSEYRGLRVIKTSEARTSGEFKVTHVSANTCTSVATEHLVNIVKYLNCMYR